MAHKTITTIIIALFALTILSANAGAVALGVNRASLQFYDVLRGGYAEDYIVVTTDTPDMLGAEILLEGEAKEWLNFSDDTFNFSRDSPYRLRVSVSPPLDSQIKEYEVNLTIITSEIYRTQQGKMGTSTRASFRIPVTIRLTGNEQLACIVGGIEVLDTEQGLPLSVRLSIINKGNVRINPPFTIEVMDKFRASSVGKGEGIFGSQILPTVTGESIRTLQMPLNPDQYWAIINVPECKYSTMVTFDVLEPGGIKDDGDFIRVEAPAWANTGDIIPIDAIFRNKGARGVRASFKGMITNVASGEIVKSINTDEYVVEPETTANIPSFFNPQEPGQYEVKGKIFYNNKLTGERSTLINVNGASIEQESTLRPAIITIIIIVIIILLLLILIRRRRQDAQR